MSVDPGRQAELDRDEQWLRSLMTPKPSDAVVARTRIAMHAAIGEQWLEAVATPVPTPALIARVKAAVHRALRANQRGVRYRVFGALSAAAAVLLAIGVARFGATGQRSMADLPLGEEFAAAWNAVQDDAGMSSLSVDMAWLDEEISVWTNKPAGQSDELELESIQDRIDGLLTTPDYFSANS